jgi:hypothetical protein
LPATVLAYLRTAKTGSVFLCLGTKFKTEVDNIVSFLGMITEGQGPKDIANFTTPFLEKVVDLAANFYQLRVKNEDAQGTRLHTKVLLGGEAARHDLASFREALKAEGADIGPFVARLRSFAWMCSPDEQREVQDAVKDKLKRRRAQLMTPLALTDSAKPVAGKFAKLSKFAKAEDEDEFGFLGADIFAFPAASGISSSSSSSKAKVSKASAPQPSPEEFHKSLATLFKKK